MLQQINTENFQQMLSQFSTVELESMIVKFPYFEQAHLLLAKKYQQENSPKFDQQLQLAALYVQDRELLYSLFKEKNVVTVLVPPIKDITPQEEQQEIEVKQAVVEQVTIIEQKEEQKAISEQTPAVEEVETAIISNADDLALALEELKQSAKAIQQISEETQKEEPVQTIQTASDFSEAEIKEISSVEETTAVTIEATQPQIEEAEQVVVSIQVAEEITEVTQEEATEDTPQTKEPSLETFSRIAPHTFDEWLQAFNNKSLGKTPEKQGTEEEQLPDEELNQLLAANITVDYLHGLVKEETNYAKGLERFIEEQIQKHKQPEIKKKATANDLDTELVTETMAKVYEMQKKYTLAIKAYEALALKFPEKSSLFAARIDFLKNIL